MSCDRELPHYEYANDVHGKPLRVCMDCHGYDGFKMCGVCKIRQEVKFFRKVKRRDGSTYPERACLECRKIRKRQYRQQASPASTTVTKVIRSATKPPGWTPPPTLEELANWHYQLQIKTKLGWGVRPVRIRCGE